MMEVKVFPSPAVAGVLSKNYVEARLHSDAPDDAARERINALQTKMVGYIVNPYYVVIDPRSGERVAEKKLDSISASSFEKFLQSAVDKSREVARR